MSGYLVDIVVTTRNNAPVLREALTSIEKQTLSDYRCYVIDDCSTDDTVAMVEREFPWVCLIKSPTQTGPSKNRNRAIALGDAPFIEINHEVEDWVHGAAVLSVVDSDFFGTGRLYPEGWSGKGVLVPHQWIVD